jgi:hypothetical protein
MAKLKSYFFPFIVAVTILVGCDYITNDLQPSRFKKPVANPDQFTTYKNQSLILNYLSNDSIKNKATVTLSDPLHGKIVKDSLNRFVYTPDQDFVGKDSIFYKVCIKSKCDSNVVVITVLAPTDTTTDSVNCSLEALNDTYYFSLSDSLHNEIDSIWTDSLWNPLDTLFTKSYLLDVLGNDVTCSDSIAALVVTQNPSKGSLQFLDNRFIYTRNQNMPFVDNSRYRFCIIENGVSRCDEAIVQINVTQ